MTKITRWLPLLLLLLLIATPIAAFAQIGPRHTDPGWDGSYWNNPSLSGEPVLRRGDLDLNFDWGFGSPDRTVSTDNFSARWTRYIDVTPGNYRFIATSDDGIRVWVDDRLLIDRWSDHPVQTFTGDIYLGPGHHLVRVEYYDRSQAAIAKLSWQLLDGPTPTPTPTPSRADGWRGEYFNNKSISGSPTVVRNDAEINFAWGTASPAPGQVNPDGFSVRWTRNLNLPAGNYRFTLTVDDGARLFVNGHTLIDAWRDQAPTTYTGDIYLPVGAVFVQVEYYDSVGGATAKLTWQRLDGGGGDPITDWKGEYYNNRNLSGTPALVRNDREINFTWSGGSPAPGNIANDNFSVRWTRTLNLPGGNYRFSITSDDGARLYVNGQLLINAWREQAPTTNTAQVSLIGQVTVILEYFEAVGGATAQLRYELVQGPTPPPPPPGAVTVDNSDPGFERGGDPKGWRSEPEGYNNSLYWTKNNNRANPNYNWGRWVPNLAAGRYEVFVYIPHRFTTTANARYWVSHREGTTLRLVNQSAYDGGAWVSLGVYNFQGNRNDFVSLSDVTFEPFLSRLIAWDAVKWEPR